MKRDIYKLEDTYTDLVALACLVGNLNGLQDLNKNSFSLVTSFLENAIIERTEVIEEIYINELNKNKNET